MPYIRDKKGVFQPSGRFDNLMMFCPAASGAKDSTSLQEYYRNLFRGLWDFVGPELDEESILDYWFVLTPLVCDSVDLHGYTPPSKSGNFIVTRYNEEDLQLVDKLIVPNIEKLARMDNGQSIPAYVMVQLNDQEALAHEKWSTEYYEELRARALNLANQSVFSTKSKVRAMIDEPVMLFSLMDEDGNHMPGSSYVEQVFEHGVEQTNGFSMADGYYRMWLDDENETDEEIEKQSQFIAMPNRDDDFCKYILSIEELQEMAKEFSEAPWVEVASNGD